MRRTLSRMNLLAKKGDIASQHQSKIKGFTMVSLGQNCVSYIQYLNGSSLYYASNRRFLNQWLLKRPLKKVAFEGKYIFSKSFCIVTDIPCQTDNCKLFTSFYKALATLNRFANLDLHVCFTLVSTISYTCYMNVIT